MHHLITLWSAGNMRGVVWWSKGTWMTLMIQFVGHIVLISSKECGMSSCKLFLKLPVHCCVDCAMVLQPYKCEKGKCPSELTTTWQLDPALDIANIPLIGWEAIPKPQNRSLFYNLLEKSIFDFVNCAQIVCFELTNQPP